MTQAVLEEHESEHGFVQKQGHTSGLHIHCPGGFASPFLAL